MENRALLRDCCEQMGVSLGEKETEQFMTYLSLLLEWNEKIIRACMLTAQVQAFRGFP